MAEMLEMKPVSPYSYIHKKMYTCFHPQFAAVEAGQQQAQHIRH